MTNRVIAYAVPAAAAVSMAVAQVKIDACDATFPEPAYEKWFSDYHKAHNDVQINYTANGSGGGVKGVTDGTVDFGVSDMTMTDQELAAVKGTIYYFPTVLGAVVPMYNLPGVTQALKFSGPTLAGYCRLPHPVRTMPTAPTWYGTATGGSSNGARSDPWPTGRDHAVIGHLIRDGKTQQKQTIYEKNRNTREFATRQPDMPERVSRTHNSKSRVLSEPTTTGRLLAREADAEGNGRRT